MATFDAHTNFGYSLVTVAPAPATTGLSLDVADASVFPAAPFNVTVCPPSVRPTLANAEIVRVTNVVGNTFTIVRAQEGTSAKSIAVGWQIANTITQKVIVDIETAVNAPVNFSAGTTSNQTRAITFADANGVSFGIDAGTITASVVPPSGAVITFSAGTTDVAAAQLSFSNANGVSFGLDGSTITAQHNGLTSQSNQAFSAGGGSSAFQTLSFANTFGVSFSNSNGSVAASIATTYAGTGFTTAGANVGLSGTLNTSGLSLSVTVPAQTNQTLGLYASSNTTLTSSGTVDARSLSVRAIGSLTAGYSAGELILSAAEALTSQSNQAISGGNGSFTFQTVSFSNANGISFGTSAGPAMTASYTVPTVTNSSWTVSDSATSLTISRLAFTNSNGVTLTLSTAAGAATVIGSHNGLTSQSTQFLALTLGGNTAGTTTFHATNNASIFLNGGNNITLSGNGSTVTISAASQTNQTVGWYASSNTTLTSSGTADARSLTVRAIGSLTAGFSNGELLLSAAAALTSQSNQAASADNGSFAFQTLSFSNLNGISFGTSAGSAITASHNAITSQSNQTLGIYGSSNTTLTSSGTIDARSLSIRAIGNLSVGYSANEIVLSGGSAANAPVNFSAGTTSNNLGSVVFSDSNGLSFGLNGSTITASANTVGTATTVYSVASANSVGTVSRWAAEDHRHAGIGAIGISTGNTSGTSGSVLGTYWIAGSNAISVSQITSNNGSHTLNVYGPPHLSYFKLVELANNTHTTAISQSTSNMQPFVLPWNYSFGVARIMASGSCAASSTQATTGNTSLSMTYVTSHNLVFYTRGTGASSLSLQYVTSTQVVDQCSMQISYAANSTQYSVSLRYSLGSQSFTKDYSSSVNSINWHTSHITDLTGVKYIDIPMALSLSPGQYWVGYGRSTNSATQAASVSVASRMVVSMNSLLAVSQNTLGALGMLGSQTHSSVMWYPAQGSYTTSGVAGTTSSVEMSAVSSLASHNILHMQFMRF